MFSSQGTISALTENGPLADLISMGGPVMVVLIAIAFIGAATFLYLMLYGAFYTPRLNKSLQRLIAQWQQSPSDTPVQAARSNAGLFGRTNPLMHLLVGTMSACQSGNNLAAVRETAVRDAQNALEPFEAPLKIIEVIAALAPLLGLLGTVMGMMEAFSAMAATEGRANASQLSGGIYEALATTAAGLVVAIPFAALAAWIEFRLRRIHKTINSALVSVFNVIPAEEVTTAPEPAKAEPKTTEAPFKEQAHASTDFDSNPRLAHAAG
ncbi:MotA/TolQ/ExbB proton channel family protein [Marinobacter sp. MDS2]|uniref:MotA/TolQ/ExbB proton channel family protein n=1 Tax=Marinobacter sp. MDS2 TaxID=3065961 RepID=UPI00273C7AAE|nr:MotA/TolQ/ExbB proton channel family protein [Marinobacter sp. MDS2]MDP4548010.1 MotA/TolQ/ExbB proton channel family protein [Marinobacter sp. MDS2]